MECFTSGDDLDGSAHDGVELFVLVHNGREGVVEDPEGKGQVDGHVLVGFCLFVQEELDDFHPDCSDDHGSGGGNGGDDLSGDELDLEVVHFLDLVVPGSQVRDSGDEFDVVVGWVIFLEFDWGSLPRRVWLDLFEMFDQFFDFLFILLVENWGFVFLFLLVNLDFDIFINELLGFNSCCELFDLIVVSVHGNIEHESENV